MRSRQARVPRRQHRKEVMALPASTADILRKAAILPRADIPPSSPDILHNKAVMVSRRVSTVARVSPKVAISKAMGRRRRRLDTKGSDWPVTKARDCHPRRPPHLKENAVLPGLFFSADAIQLAR